MSLNVSGTIRSISIIKENEDRRHKVTLPEELCYYEKQMLRGVLMTMRVLHRPDAPGDWGIMAAPPGGTTGTARLTEAGKPDIFYRYWRVKALGTLFLLHGLGAHSGWFIDMCNSLAAQGVNIYTMDHRGFGRSGGARGDAVDWRHFIEDIDRMVDIIHRDLPGTKIFPLGHSMGGIFATYYAARSPEKLGGVILLNPWIADTSKTPIGALLSGLIGGITHSPQIARLPNPKATTGMTSNPEANAFLLADNYWVYERTKRFYWQVAFQMRGKVLEMARKVTIPALVIQGEADAAVIPAATKKAFDTLSSRDKTYLSLPGYEHDAEFHADRAQLDDAIAAWIKQHSS